MKNPNKYFKTLKFTVAEIDTIDERLNAASKMIEEHGGLVVGCTSPVTFGVKPIHLIYTLIYTASGNLDAALDKADGTRKGSEANEEDERVYREAAPEQR